MSMTILAIVLVALIVTNVVLVVANAHLLLRQKRQLRDFDRMVAKFERHSLRAVASGAHVSSVTVGGRRMAAVSNRMQ